MERQMGGRSIHELVNALRDNDEGVRQQAAIELEHNRAKRTLEQLVEALNDNDSDVQCYAADGLGSLKDSRAVEPLMHVITRSSDGSFAAEAALNALQEIGEPAVDPLIAILESADDEMRPYAADVLGIVGDRRAAEPLAVAARDNDIAVRTAALYALKKISAIDSSN